MNQEYAHRSSTGIIEGAERPDCSSDNIPACLIKGSHYAHNDNVLKIRSGISAMTCMISRHTGLT